jgi:predicted ATPase/class 3 adenylate cyclase/DNA-binding CsgD family transcriptional regulator
VDGRDSLPVGTVTLLVTDVEGSTALWESEREAMTTAVAHLDQVIAAVIPACSGVRPVQQGDGDSLLVAFARASQAVACALALQRETLAPIRLRIGVHTGEVQLGDEGIYLGAVPDRTARLRDLAQGGQTLLSGATASLVIDSLPDGAWLTELGTHRLRGFERAERVLQLCHDEVAVDFPPLRAADQPTGALATPLTSFIGRREELSEIRALVADQRLVTLTGTGGVGKTRLAVRIAEELRPDFADGIWLVELASVTDPGAVAAALLRTLGIPEQGRRSSAAALVRAVGKRRMLVVLDNCEHLLDPIAELVTSLLQAPRLKVLTTSREPLGVAGEVAWRVPSMSLTDEAVELFVDRARRVRPGFAITREHAAEVVEICRRLDGVPLAIELAAARLRVLSVAQLLASLHDRFRLLVTATRGTERRQQALRASVDWSHDLLTEPERILFRRLAPFVGSFDLAAAEAVSYGDGLETHQVFDQLTSLVDKSLVIADESGGQMRYRLLETMRHYATERLGEANETAAVRARHRDHYSALAERLERMDTHCSRRIEGVEADFDNVRAAFDWTCDEGDMQTALRIASALQPLWIARGRFVEGMRWFDAALGGRDAATPIEVAALADREYLATWASRADSDAAARAVAAARRLGDIATLARALAAAAVIAGLEGDTDSPFLAEAIRLATDTGLRWLLCQLLGWCAAAGNSTGDGTVIDAARDGLALAVEIGDEFVARMCRTWLAHSLLSGGRIVDAMELFAGVVAAAETAGDPVWQVNAMLGLSRAFAYRGAAGEAIDVLQTADAIVTRAGLENLFAISHPVALCRAAMAAGDAVMLSEASARVWAHIEAHALSGAGFERLMAESALAIGDLPTATTWADRGVASTVAMPYYAALARICRARVRTAIGDNKQAHDDAVQALNEATSIGTLLLMPDIFDCLAIVAADDAEATLLYAVADRIRCRIGAVRDALHRAEHEAALAATRERLGDGRSDACWAAGAALPLEDAVTRARRGRGRRARTSSGWASLTPTERSVAQLVADGLANKEIAARLIMSPRTVQSHLTHIYTKLGVTSRVHLARETQRHHQPN